MILKIIGRKIEYKYNEKYNETTKYNEIKLWHTLLSFSDSPVAELQKIQFIDNDKNGN